MGWRNAFVALCALSSVVPSTHAWTYVWRDSGNHSYVESGNSDFACKEIDNPKGMIYEYDSEQDPTRIYMYWNTNCSGPPGGEADNYYSQPAGNHVRSFRIEDRTKRSTTSDSASTSISATSSTTNIATTVTSSPGPTTSEAGSSGSSLPGGAIAGVVVGAVAGVALIAALLFFLLRRRKKAVGSGIPNTEPPPPMSQGQVGPVDEDQTKKEEIKVAPPAQTPAPMRLVELTGDVGMVELSDTHQVNELEGNTQRLHKS